jgi:pilus assembly protein CpaF
VIPREIFAQTLLEFFEPIRPFLDDPRVSDILINGPDLVYVERGGQLELTGARFESGEDLEAALRNAAQFAGKFADDRHPILEGWLPDGSRIEAVLPPVSHGGPHVSIRRFSRTPLTIGKLVELGSLTDEAGAALHAIVASKLNVVVAGGTGSGKTSLLNALAGFVPPRERIVVIEDTRELQLQREHVVHFEARPPDRKGRGAVGIRDIFRATLRMRPDRIVVGEIRGGEALDLVQAMTSGHGGCLTTLHATYPRDTLSRLETMAMMTDVEMPLAALRLQIASAIEFIVQTARMQDGSRKITHISEVRGYDPSASCYRVQDIFVRRYHGLTEAGEVRSVLEATGAIPDSVAVLRSHGLDLPPSVYQAAATHRNGQDEGERPDDLSSAL